MAEEKETGRVEAFSDGVFAIAATLLVLELRVPLPGELAAGETLFTALRHAWPTYLAFVTSFATILIVWTNHHNL
ncbi:MAG TPA: TMEM175 family protein, partial [Thermomicrobiales bacterium]|nr:TMEM175 family protein [Thermomicrobiales bacterium]